MGFLLISFVGTGDAFAFFVSLLPSAWVAGACKVRDSAVRSIVREGDRSASEANRLVFCRSLTTLLACRLSAAVGLCFDTFDGEVSLGFAFSARASA